MAHTRSRRRWSFVPVGATPTVCDCDTAFIWRSAVFGAITAEVARLSKDAFASLTLRQLAAAADAQVMRGIDVRTDNDASDYVAKRI